MTALRFQHVSVPCRPDELARCSAFYRDVLGMRPIPNLAGSAWFAFGDGLHVHLLAGEGLAGTRAHFALQVDDLAGVLDACRAAGREPAEQPCIWGAERWFVRDPAGNLLELFATPPPATPPAPAG